MVIPCAQSQSSGLTSFVYATTNQQVVLYVGSDQNIYELYWTPGASQPWNGSNITAAAGLPKAAGGSSLTSFVDAATNQQVILYIGVDQNVYEVYWTPGASPAWNGDSVTTAAGLPLAAAGSALTSFVYTYTNQQVIAYIGTDQNVYELYWTPGANPAWAGSSVTTAAGLPKAANGTALTSFVFGPSRQQVILYVGQDQNVYDLYWTPGATPAWAGNSVTTAANLPKGAPNSSLTSFVDSSNQQVVFYIGSDQNVYELYWTSGANPPWTGSSVTTAANLPKAATDSSLTSFVLSSTNQQVIFYVGSDQNIYELYWTPGANPPWNGSSVTTAAGLPKAAAGSSLTSFVYASTNQQVIFYEGQDQNIYELYWTPGANPPWAGESITSVTAKPTAFFGVDAALGTSVMPVGKSPSTPSQEYVYFGGQAVAIERHP